MASIAELRIALDAAMDQVKKKDIAYKNAYKVIYYYFQQVYSDENTFKYYFELLTQTSGYKDNKHSADWARVRLMTDYTDWFENQLWNSALADVGPSIGSGASGKAGSGNYFSNGARNTLIRGAKNTSELNVNQFKGLKNNGVVKVNSSGSDRPAEGTPNSYYTTANGEHVFVYDGQGKLIYDLSRERVKAFKINVNPAGQEFYQPYKLEGTVPQSIKDLFGW